MGRYSLDPSDAARGAQARGNVIVYPEDNELFIDIDSEQHFNTFRECWAIFKQHCASAEYIERSSPSGEKFHYHVVVKLPFMVDATERIAMQAALGSDPKREILSLVRLLLKGDTKATLFYEKPAKTPLGVLEEMPF